MSLRKGDILDVELPESLGLEVAGRVMLLVLRDSSDFDLVVGRVIQGHPNDLVGWVPVPHSLFCQQLVFDLSSFAFPPRLVPRLEALVACNKRNSELEALLCLSN